MNVKIIFNSSIIGHLIPLLDELFWIIAVIVVYSLEIEIYKIILVVLPLEIFDFFFVGFKILQILYYFLVLNIL